VLHQLQCLDELLRWGLITCKRTHQHSLEKLRWKRGFLGRMDVAIQILDQALHGSKKCIMSCKLQLNNYVQQRINLRYVTILKKCYFQLKKPQGLISKTPRHSSSSWKQSAEN
jgi:hypothetical protein